MNHQLFLIKTAAIAGKVIRKIFSLAYSVIFTLAYLAWRTFLFCLRVLPFFAWISLVSAQNGLDRSREFRPF